MITFLVMYITSIFLTWVACLLIMSAISFVKQSVWIFYVSICNVFLSTTDFNKKRNVEAEAPFSRNIYFMANKEIFK